MPRWAPIEMQDGDSESQRAKQASHPDKGDKSLTWFTHTVMHNLSPKNERRIKTLSENEIAQTKPETNPGAMRRPKPEE